MRSYQRRPSFHWSGSPKKSFSFRETAPLCVVPTTAALGVVSEVAPQRRGARLQAANHEAGSRPHSSAAATSTVAPPRGGAPRWCSLPSAGAATISRWITGALGRVCWSTRRGQRDTPARGVTLPGMAQNRISQLASSARADLRRGLSTGPLLTNEEADTLRALAREMQTLANAREQHPCALPAPLQPQRQSQQQALQQQVPPQRQSQQQALATESISLAQLCTSCYSLHGPWLNGRLQVLLSFNRPAIARRNAVSGRGRGVLHARAGETAARFGSSKAAAAAAKVAERLRMELWHTKQRLAENRATELATPPTALPRTPYWSC